MVKIEAEMLKENKTLTLKVDSLRKPKETKSPWKKLLSPLKMLKNKFPDVANSFGGNQFDPTQDSSTDITVDSGIIPNSIFDRPDFRKFYETKFSENGDRI